MGLISKPLPAYTGPYPVSTLDLEFATHEGEERSFGTALLKSTRQPALRLQTVLFTLFFPCDSNDRNKTKRVERMDWVQRPLTQTSAGYARFTNKPNWLVRLLFILFAANKKLPAEIDRPLRSPSRRTEHRPVDNGKVDGSTTSTLIDSAEEDSGTTFPLAIFSHGLGGNRTTYSQYCGELASRGYIVAAVEHRDGSGPISVVRLEGNGHERVVDYIKPEDLEFLPPNRPLSQLEHRREQLEMKLAEIEQVLHFLRRVNSGEGSSLASLNRRSTSSSYGSQLSSWKNRIDFTKLSQLGHSFGGATTLQILRAGREKFPFVNGICLDPWCDPIDPASTTTTTTTTTTTKESSAAPIPLSDGQGQNEIKRGATEIDVPILAINSEAFTLWQTHYKLVRTIVEKTKEPSWFMTLVGSIHLSFSDFPIILPFIASKTGARVDSNLAMSKFVQASDEFLSGQGIKGSILGQPVLPGDENGVREGEGYKQRGGKPMEIVGQIRMHVTPQSEGGKNRHFDQEST